MRSAALLEQTISRIRPIAPAALARAFQRLDALAKPRRSLGYLEEIAARCAAMLPQESPRLASKHVFVFAGDHGVVQEGISAYPSTVTALMVKSFLGGAAAINVLARQAGVKIKIIDIGMAQDLGRVKGLQRCNVKRGTDNIAQGPAMTPDQALKAIAVGIKQAEQTARQRIALLATGDMGIGNTTSAAALFSAFLNLPASQTVGPGTGLDVSGVNHKIEVVDQAIARNRPLCQDALGTLAALGGLEIAGICGLCLGGAAQARPVVVDGFIASAGALAAMRICPAVRDYLFFAHMSAEPGHRIFFARENLRPLVDLGLRLGEGTGAVIAIQIIEDALAIYNHMASFAEAGIAPGA